LNNVQKPEPILCGNRKGRASRSVSPPGEFPFSNELFAPNNATAAEPQTSLRRHRGFRSMHTPGRSRLQVGDYPPDAQPY
jgi:hypothetical protein